MIATMSFDVTGMTLVNIKRGQQAEKLSVFLVRALKVCVLIAAKVCPDWLRNLMSLMFARAIVWYVDHERIKVTQRVVWYEGAAAHLEREIAQTGVFPPQLYVTKLQEYKDVLDRHIAEGEAIAADIKRLRPRTQIAEALLRMLKNLSQLSSAVDALRYVATGQALEVAQQREVFLGLAVQIANNDVEDLDEELLEMATQAIAASDGRDWGKDPQWAERMTQGPLH